ncbi:MAG: tetratricopeptide repeat protein [Treponema sp.]|jgi:Flp pilus assembly protein TadD|nr:tetratricopeptide repeat protein [Treponema sp.]
MSSPSIDNPDAAGARVVFIKIPPSFKLHIHSISSETAYTHPAHGDDDPDDLDETPDGAVAAFAIDPEIPLPIELAPGDEKINLEELSLEMILSGMLRVLAGSSVADALSDGQSQSWQSQHWSDYYRRMVLALRPNILPEFTEAAILKARNGDYALALEILAALKGLYPRSPSVLLNRAIVLEERAAALERTGQETAAEGEYVAAEAAYVEALDVPTPEAFFNAGQFYLKRRDFSRALVCLRAYTSLEDQDDGAGGLVLDEEKRADALRLVREIEDHGLEDEDFKEAWEHIRHGREKEGMERIRPFLERRPNVWNGWFLLGWALRRLTRWEDARAALEKALELGGDTSDTRNELAICLMETNDFSAARRQLEIALRGDPENIKIISNLGVLAMRAGNEKEAAGFFRTVLELEPEDPLARQYFSAK